MAARLVTGSYSYHASPTEMIKEIGWQSLAGGRVNTNTVMMYKMQPDCNTTKLISQLL